MKTIDAENTKKKSKILIAEIVVLSIMLLITTYALFSNVANINGNTFSAQGVSIEINDGQKLFDYKNMLIEPGKAIEKVFTVKNTGTADAYFKLFLENLDGSAKDSIEFEIYSSEDNFLFESSANDFTNDNPFVNDTVVSAGQEIKLKMVVKMLKGTGNEYQGSDLTFDVVGKSTQAKNNAIKLF